MKRNLIIYSSSLLAIFFMLTSCIERFYMNGDSSNFIPEIVIEGTVKTDETMQEIVVSQTSSPENPQFDPISECNVKVENDSGGEFMFSETGQAGHYSGYIPVNHLVNGARFRLSVMTPEGKQYYSRYEEVTPCPPVGAICYDVESRQTSDPDVTEDGAQFYLDLDAPGNYGNYYRWTLEETYEYHSTWPITRYMDDTGDHTLSKADYSFFTCYKTEDINDIFILSTQGLSQNSYQKYPLNFVNDHTQRLMYRYSLLVKQYSMSASAYNFWDKLRKNNKESAGLFAKQPSQVKGNIYNVNDTSEVVLGYFGVSSVTSRRVMVPGLTQLGYDQVSFCTVTKPDPQVPLPEDRPLYWAQGVDENGVPYWGYADSECFICTMLGGTTEKPSYWDEQ